MIERKDLKTYMKICEDNNDLNSQLDLSISNAIWFVTDYLMYNISYNANRIATFCKTDTSFDLPFTDIFDVSAVKSWSDEFDDSLVDYQWAKKLYKESWLLKTKECVWPYVEITFAYWFDCWKEAVNPTPAWLKAVLLSIASKYYKNMGEVALADLQAETVDGDRVWFKEGLLNRLTPTEIDILDKYKRYGFSA